ncbi:uncharacterized protein F5Z01DRAFT_637507 [Emericellopsis atlantica]|uniref:Uncharacterized protein n=1 Tax=Emericellopsis atlantica TaxID=2614577 RepID=A0A9P7ZK88_9HYPO|nr:uncharacterized protein F5Z01DRAFT_637507 [Emericellopsis atlantica]KAG9253251.1 hypothetical protein F5Z01DRAFT_637507 [Emericellopsis atlantica]
MNQLVLKSILDPIKFTPFTLPDRAYKDFMGSFLPTSSARTRTQQSGILYHQAAPSKLRKPMLHPMLSYAKVLQGIDRSEVLMLPRMTSNNPPANPRAPNHHQQHEDDTTEGRATIWQEKNVSVAEINNKGKSKLNAKANSFRSDSSDVKPTNGSSSSELSQSCQGDHENCALTPSSHAQQPPRDYLAADKAPVFDPALMVAQSAYKYKQNRRKTGQSSGQKEVEEPAETKSANCVVVWRGDSVVYLPPPSPDQTVNSQDTKD